MLKQNLLIKKSVWFRVKPAQVKPAKDIFNSEITVILSSENLQKILWRLLRQIQVSAPFNLT